VPVWFLSSQVVACCAIEACSPKLKLMRTSSGEACCRLDICAEYQAVGQHAQQDSFVLLEKQTLLHSVRKSVHVASHAHQ
jgi:hypothetical protein